MTRERLFYIDNIKGLLIILVVLGHSIQATGLGVETNIINRFIYSFHMPAFMAISGFLCYNEGVLDLKKIIKKKVECLLLPYFAWTVILTILTPSLSLSSSLIEGSSLWFLWVLFAFFIMYYLTSYTSSNICFKYSFEISLLLFWMLCCYLSAYKYFNLPLIAYHFPFFVLGIIIKKYNVRIKEFKHPNFLFAYWIIGSFFCSEILLQEIIPSHSLALIHLIYLLQKYLVASSAILSIFCFFSKHYNKRYKYLTYFGSITMGIYTISVSIEGQLFKYIIPLFNNLFFAIIICFIVVFLTSLVLNKLLSIYYITRLLLLGKK